MRGKQDSWMEVAPASGDGPVDASVGTSTVGMSRKWLGRATRVVVAGALVTTSGLALTAGPASAAVPTFPANLLVFPNRDFVSVAGFADHAGRRRR
jgi:hypothetical protein